MEYRKMNGTNIIANLKSNNCSVSFYQDGKYFVQLEGHELNGCQARLYANGSEHELNWTCCDKNQEKIVLKAENSLGAWSLIFQATSNRSGVQGIAIAFCGNLNRSCSDIKMICMEIPELSADHIISQGIRMGGCNSIALPTNETKAHKSYYQLVMRRGNSFVQFAFPLIQQQPNIFEADISGDRLNSFRAGSEMKHYSGTELLNDSLSIYASDNGFKLMEDWADDNTVVQKDFSTPMAPGWNSWDYYRWTITEEEVLKNAEFIARDPVLSKHVKRIIVDDGWQYCYGEWEANSLFPNGMKYLADELTKMGFEPGLWVAPTIIEPHCRVAQRDFDMLAMGENGLPCLAYECMKRLGFVLDPTVGKAQKYMTDIFSRYADMGYKYFKLDFLGSTLNARKFADQTVPRSKLMNRIVQPIYDAIKAKATLLGCNYHFDGGNSCVDTVRIAADIHSKWDSLKNNAVSVASRYWSNKRWWINDPDFALCRGFDTSNDPDLNRIKPCMVFNAPGNTEVEDAFNKGMVDLSRPQIEIALSLVLAAAGAINLSDDMTKLNEIGVELARKTVSAEPGETAIPLDLFESERVSRWLQKVSDGWRVLLINWTDEPVEQKFCLKEHGIEADSAVNFWSDEKVELTDGKIIAKLAPRTCLFATLS